MRLCLLYAVLPLILSSCQKGPVLGPGDESVLASAAQEDCGYVQNSYGERISWKKNIPVQLTIHKSFPKEFIGTLEDAATKWNDAAGMTLFIFTEDPNLVAEKSAKDSVSTIHWLSDWPDNKKEQQAVTNLYWKNNQLTESDMAIDNKYFNFYLTQTNTSNDVHLESLLVHELGHVLGLRHRSTVPSVMWSVLTSITVRTTLGSADRESLKCEY